MGWWWSDSSSEESTCQSKPESDPALRQSTTPSAPLQDESSADVIPLSNTRPRTREEAAFAELKELFTTINPEAASRADETARNPPPPASEELAETLYPIKMSCSQAFDQAYYCSSMSGQLGNVYRYGGLRSCTEQWKQWRFCMRTKAMSDDEKKRRIREFYMEKNAKKRVGRSSERIWEVRTEPVVGAFGKKLEAYEEEAGVSVTGV